MRFSNVNEQKWIEFRYILKVKMIRCAYGFNSFGKKKESTQQLFSIFEQCDRWCFLLSWIV